MNCPECGTSIDQPSRGRPREFCSSSCSAAARQRKKRARQGAARAQERYLDSIKATKAERKVFAVWNDDAKRAEWVGVLQTHRALLAKLARDYGKDHDLPVETSGKSAVVIDNDGTSVFHFDSLLTGTVQMAVAELVHDRQPSEITKAMITNRVRARLTDELRKSDEFERPLELVVPIQDEPVTITTVSTGAQRVYHPIRTPQMKRVTRRKATPTRRYDRSKRIVEDRATAVVDRGREMARVLTLPEHLVYFVYIQARQHSSTLARLWNMPQLRVPGGSSRPLSAEDWRDVAADGPGSTVEAVRAFFEGMSSPEVVDGLLRSALEKLGEPELPEELLDDGMEEAVSDEGDREVAALLGAGRDGMEADEAEDRNEPERREDFP